MPAFKARRMAASRSLVVTTRILADVARAGGVRRSGKTHSAGIVGDDDIDPGSVRDRIIQAADERLEGRLLAQGGDQPCAKERVGVHDQDGVTARRNAVHEVSPSGRGSACVSLGLSSPDVFVAGLKIS